ncbi:penicillin-binding protein 2 [Sandaracinobacteroides hominis]|uniref:penicillin-binding protein 2 n=1 Tax=Sandaracinobacteroides hominis TaxID=2780086 RepID=UPI0018F404AA|nr:penicillin-binding protein 2 [Sandaracinobacteroides hominis]
MAQDGGNARLFERRAFFLGAIQAGAGVALLGRMAYLSIAEADKYKMAAEDNRVALHLIPPRRGWIVDAAGAAIATNRPAYAVDLIPSLVPDLEAALQRIAAVVPLDPADRARILEEAKDLPPSAALTIADDIGWDAFAALNVELADMAGLQPQRTYVRHYPDGDAFAHVTGYVGRATAEQYKKTKEPLYLVPGFRVGKDGVERSEDAVLRGKAGARRVEVNARGRIVKELDTRIDVPGHNVQLTIDRGLQAFAAARVGNESCSVAVIDVVTGDIKCLLSMPAFDPNVFSNRIPSQLWKDLQADEKKPLLNKTLQGLYVPGSTFKPVTALAALHEGILPTDQVHCSGAYRVGNNTWHCHKRSGHGTVNMRSGIAKSCNVYFYTMARRVGPQAVADMARVLGLEHKFDLPMPVQRAGIIPDPAWKQERYDQKWSVADTLNMAIGQGYVIVNPLQLAVMTARIATGKIVEPRMLAGAPQKAFAPLPVPLDYLEVVRQGMDDVVNGPGGTARASQLNVPGIRMGGKTGTAQVRRISAGFRGGAGVPWKYRDHALFIAFAPVDNPRYAISVVVEHGIGGSKAAAPIAKDVLTYIYDREQAEKRLAGVLEARERARVAAEEALARAAAEAEAARQAALNPGAVSAAPAATPAAGTNRP